VIKQPYHGILILLGDAITLCQFEPTLILNGKPDDLYQCQAETFSLLFVFRKKAASEDSGSDDGHPPGES